MFASSAISADLTVYTYDSFISEWGPGPQLEKAFEQQCSCNLEFIAAEDGVSILNRLRIEGNKTKADLILGIDEGLLEETRKTGLVQSHNIDLSGLKAELNWHDSDFVPFDYGYFSFIYNSEKITQPATSLKNLIESDASVIYQDPRTSTPGQGLMMWVKSVYGDKAPAAWKQLSKHTVTVTKGWWEAYSMFLEGDADYVLSYNTSPAYHVVAEQKTQYKAAPFKEGHVAQVEVAAITANSTNKDRAQQFLKFLISKEAQSIIPVTNWMMPVIPGMELPDAFADLIQPQRIGFSPETMADNRKSWVREWRNAVSE
ncbi:thiamine ABC transporter substrate binding subunit [Motiliproteus sp. MSK22-1]|nr:thiamine ABC transporter substrate binding subunit [Motiliproteus sp. MSK22-1]